jgi:tetratricopeptide (TPR) repeat protein
LYPAALVFVGALVYANSLNGVFTFDDAASVAENSSIRQLWPLSGPLSPPDRGEPVAGRPVVNLSFAINYALHGLDVRGYHVFNIGVHLACALLLYGLIRWTASLKASGYQAIDDVAFAAALLWMVHPLVTEAVNYISQRTELMMALFYLLTLYASVRAAEARLKPDPTYEGRLWTAIAIVSCALGMASKETMVTVPLVVMLYDRIFLYHSFKEAVRARAALYAGLASTWVLLAALIWSGPRWESAGFSTGISVWTYLLNQTVMLVEYLKRAVWPVNLILDYGEPRSLTLADVAPQAALIVGLLVATIAALVRRPAVGFLAAVFFIILAPTSSILPIATEVGAERRMYLPLAALAVLAVLSARSLLGRVRVKQAAITGVAFLSAVTFALGVLSVRRNAEYSDERGLWATTLARWPHARAHRNYATLLKRAGYRDEVIEHLRLSLDGHPEARYGLGYELYAQGRIDEAVEELQRFARELPSDRFVPTARAIVGDVLLSRGRFADASVEYDAVVRANPAFGKAWSNLGVALAQSGRRDEAIRALERAVTLEPRDPTARRNMAAMLIEQDRVEEALPHAEAAAQLEPGNPANRFLFGLALSYTDRLDESIAHLRASLELDPSNGDAREQLARVEQQARRRGSTGP